MSCENKYQTIEKIAEWILKCLEGIERGTHKVDYLRSEIYGCCEKILETADIEEGNEEIDCIKNNESKRSSKKRSQVYVVRLSEAANCSSTKIIKIGEKEYTILTGDDLKGLHSEHIYPRSLLLKDFLNLENPTKEKIVSLIKERGKVAYITEEESDLLDKKLTAEQVERLKKQMSNSDFKKYEIKEGDILKNKMPEGWDEKSVDERLKARGIELKDQLFLVADI